MKIPSDLVERNLLYEEVATKCLASRSRRFDFYKLCRNYALFGAAEDQGAPYNKIGATLETLTSFIYAADDVRFQLLLGDSAPPADLLKAPPLAREIDQQWRMSGTHILFGQAVYWALVFGVMLLKTIWRDGIARNYLVEPHQFGVYREDLMSLDDQEAFIMCYTITRTELEDLLEGNPKKASIMEQLTPGLRDQLTFSDGMTRLLSPLDSPVGGIPGSIAPGGAPGGPLRSGGRPEGGLVSPGSTYDYLPEMANDLIGMTELYVRNDETKEYQCVTRAAPGVTIFDRPQSQVTIKGGGPCFTVVRADDTLYDYFWGRSFVAGLAALQDWRTGDIGNIQLLQNKQADPPVSFVGIGGIAQEKLQALRASGGAATIDSPQGKIEVHTPKLPEDSFATITQIDGMFDDSAGLGHILQGKGESGVRSKGQADLMARLGSARPKKRAAVVEECANDCASLMLRFIQQYSDQRFHTEAVNGAEPMPFIANEFTTDFEARVDAHSSSPIFVEDARGMADELLERRCIDRETYLEMIRPPNLQLLKERLKEIEKKEEIAAKMKMAAEAAKHGSTGRPPEGGA